jgi:mycothiol synthase
MTEVTMVAGLPDRFIARAATLDDAQAVTDLANVCAVVDIGYADTEVSDTVTDWQSPYCNPQTNIRLVLEGDRLVGYAGLWVEPPCAAVWSWCRVHPDYLGQGIGAYLAEWIEASARTEGPAWAPEGTRIALRQTKPDQDSVSRDLLLRNGYRPIRHFLRMVIDLDSQPPEPAFPAGLTVRTFDRANDLALLVRVEQEIFRDHWGFVALDFEQDLAAWAHWLDHDPSHDPSLWFLVMDGVDIAGVCLCRSRLPGEPEVAYVHSLGVRREWRHQGVGLAMLHLAFGEFYRQGKAQVKLDVDADSLTGATRLYERAGMRVLRGQTAYELVLREGEDLSTQALDA